MTIIMHKECSAVYSSVCMAIYIMTSYNSTIHFVGVHCPISKVKGVLDRVKKNVYNFLTLKVLPKYMGVALRVVSKCMMQVGGGIYSISIIHTVLCQKWSHLDLRR